MSSTPANPFTADQLYPAHLYMPPDGIPFDYTAYVATPAVGVVAAVVQFTVPEGFHGVIKKVGNVYVGTGFIEGSGSLVWQIQQNGGVVRNYDNILASLGTVTQPGELAGSILIFEQQVVTLQVNNVSLVAGGTQVGGRLGGWFFPKEYLNADMNIWG
jgi:hypothetical protein